MTIANFRIPEQEERQMALRVAGVLWLTAATTSFGGALLPGTNADMPVMIAMGVLEVAWACLCLVFPWDRHVNWESSGRLVFHVPTWLSFAFIAGTVAATGGAHSYASYFLFFVVCYVACFYRRREALGYIFFSPFIHALPLLYQGSAVRDGLLQQLWGSVPAYVMLGGVIIVGREQLTRLRDTASTLSLTDPLTGLPNRRAFEERMARQLAAPSTALETGVVLVDLDDFKEVNTVYGHPGGDAVLCAVAHALREAGRDTDLVARLGGDEFAIVAAGDVEGLGALAARVLETVRLAHERLPEDLEDFRITASVGWSRHPHDGETLDELIAAADFCLRGVKASGKNASSTPLDWLPPALETADPA